MTRTLIGTIEERLLPVECCVPVASVGVTDDQAATLATLFKALSDPNRVRIVNLLATSDEPVCVCDFVPSLGLAQGTVHSPLHDQPPGATVAVCYIDGPWQPPPEVRDVYARQGVVADRGVVLVVRNRAAPIQGPIAPHESLPAQRPTSTPRP